MSALKRLFYSAKPKQLKKLWHEYTQTVIASAPIPSAPLGTGVHEEMDIDSAVSLKCLSAFVDCVLSNNDSIEEELAPDIVTVVVSLLEVAKRQIVKQHYLSVVAVDDSITKLLACAEMCCDCSDSRSNLKVSRSVDTLSVSISM